MKKILVVIAVMGVIFISCPQDESGSDDVLIPDFLQNTRWAHSGGTVLEFGSDRVKISGGRADGTYNLTEVGHDFSVYIDYFLYFGEPKDKNFNADSARG